MIKKTIIIANALLSVMFIYSCGALQGSHDLGNRLTLWEGDEKETTQIIYCIRYNFGACMSGIPVIPSKADSILRYAKDAKSNKNWVIARSIRTLTGTEDFWIINKNFSIEDLDCDKINCDSIIQSHVRGPFNKIEFNTRKSQIGIDMDF